MVWKKVWLERKPIKLEIVEKRLCGMFTAD